MTGKERIRIAFTRAGEPDRVPVEPGFDYDALVDLSELDCWQFRDAGRTELGDLVDWSDRLGCELYHYAAGIPEPNPADGIRIQAQTWREDDVEVAETEIVTDHGTLRQRRRCPRRNPAYTHEKLIKDPRADWPAFRAYCGEIWPVHPRYFDEYARAGDRGAVGAVVHSPIDWWQEYRHGGIEQVIFDLLDEPAFMEEVFAYYREQSLHYLHAVARLTPRPDFVMIHGSNCSASVMAPALVVRHVQPFVREAAALLAAAGIPSLFHVCGRSREMLDIVADSDLQVIDALEAPPSGNVDLAEVKRSYGGRLCLKGNVPVLIMVYGTPAQVRDEVRRCLDAAAAGGGFMLSVGDSIGPRANRANIEEMVAAALEYGQY